jgi:hypothetical protein
VRDRGGRQLYLVGRPVVTPPGPARDPFDACLVTVIICVGCLCLTVIAITLLLSR